MTQPQATATVYAWDQLPQDFPMPLIERRRIIGEKAMLSQVFLHKGFVVAQHQHENEQFVIVLSGRVLFGVNGEDSEFYQQVTLTEGQVLHLPSNVPHSAHALEDTLIIDVFSPPSETTGVDSASAHSSAGRID